MALVGANRGSRISQADRKRQAEWRAQNVEKIKTARAARLESLDGDREAIVDATHEYSRLDEGNVPSILLRRQFVALDTARQLRSVHDGDAEELVEFQSEAAQQRRAREIATRPPLTRLTHRHSNALSLYLTAVYVAHLEAKPGSTFTNTRRNALGTKERRAWIVLSGLSAAPTKAAKRARMRRALDELAIADLAALDRSGRQKRYEKWSLLSDTGTDAPYRVPSERDPDALAVPASFFYNGWHLALSPGEIAMLLAIMHRNWQRGGTLEPEGRQWVSLPEPVRQKIYGISDELYLHAQQLIEFGLIDFNDPMPTRRRGKIAVGRVPFRPIETMDEDDNVRVDSALPMAVPYLFMPGLPEVFNRDAFSVVRDTLRAFKSPYRLDDNAVFMPPQDLARFYSKNMPPSTRNDE